MITALLFDFGGTLDGPTHWLDRFLGLYAQAGIDMDRSELDPAFDFATRAGYRASRALERFELRDLVRFLVGQQFEYLARSGPDRVRACLLEWGATGRHRMVERITASFATDTATGLVNSREVLSKLKPRYKIGVVSNFYGNLDRILAETGLKKFVDATVDSSRIGIFKPEAAIFQAALKALNLGAAEAAMVGDSLEKDCAPARRLGLKTVWFCPSGRNGGSSGAGLADYTIRALEDLVTIDWR